MVRLKIILLIESNQKQFKKMKVLMNQKLICALLATAFSLQIYSMERESNPLQKKLSLEKQLTEKQLTEKQLPQKFSQPCEMCASQCSTFCSQCRITFYCSAMCQTLDSKNHKEYCKRITLLIQLGTKK